MIRLLVRNSAFAASVLCVMPRFHRSSRSAPSLQPAGRGDVQGCLAECSFRTQSITPAGSDGSDDCASEPGLSRTGADGLAGPRALGWFFPGDRGALVVEGDFLLDAP